MPAIVALALAGCGAGEGALRLTVDGTAAGVAYLQIVATVDGLTSQPAVVPLPDGLPAAFQLRFPRERHGPAVLHVEAMTEAGRVVAAGGAVVDVLPSFEMAARVVLSGEAVAMDGGTPDLVWTTDMREGTDLVPPPDSPPCTPRTFINGDGEAVPCGCYGLICCQNHPDESCNHGFACARACPGSQYWCYQCR